MAAGDYLKVAASQLRRAAQALQQQAHGLLAERDRAARQKSSEITDQQLAAKAHQMRLYKAGDNREKVRLGQELHTMQKQIETKQQEIADTTQKLEGAAQAKQDRAVSLESKARELESQASAPELAT
jgi:predicted  nucleic acid-binding Zn-ribbon protein